MAEQGQQRRGREGGRWVNERPTSEEFGTWFAENMKIDPALDSKDYVGGVVLIPALDERTKYVKGFTAEGVPVVELRPELSYIPYAKVETRITYFWDLLDAHPEWVGVVEPVELGRLPIDQVSTIERRESSSSSWTSREHIKPGALTAMVHQLPPGFSVTSIPVGDGYSHFLCCTMRVSIFDREELKADRHTIPLRTGRGTKQVPLLMGRHQPYADPNSLMKAETGALGRALGFAGIFVIPGSGIATAEDMQEALTQGATAAQADPASAGPEAPDQPPAKTGAEQVQDETAQLMERAKEMWKTLSDDYPEHAQEFGQWAKSRNLSSLGEAKGAMLRGTVKKLEKLIDAAEQSAQQATSEEEPDVPAEAPETGSVAERPEEADPDAEPSGSTE